MTRALVIGATGFVGRHLVSRLLEKGVSVRATYRDQPHSPDGPNLEWVRLLDLEKQRDWTGILDDVRYVFHLAAVAHRSEVADRALAREYRRVNVEGTRNLVIAVGRSRSVSRFLFVSSVAAGPVQREAVASGDSRVLTEYGRSKLAGERIVRDELRGRIDWCTLRPCLVYGPGHPGNMARLDRLVRKGVPLPFRGVSNRRSFLFVGNLVDALLTCATHPEARRRTFTVSDGVSLSTPELVEKIASASGARVRLFEVPERLIWLVGHAGDLLQRVLGRPFPVTTSAVERLLGSFVVDSEEMKKLLGWRPRYSLEEGIQATFASRQNQTKVK